MNLGRTLIHTAEEPGKACSLCMTAIEVGEQFYSVEDSDAHRACVDRQAAEAMADCPPMAAVKADLGIGADGVTAPPPDELEALKHELFVMTASNRMNGEYARAFELERDAALRLLERAWGVIANAGGGDWTRENAEWQQAAAVWRDLWREMADTTKARPNQPSDLPPVTAEGVQDFIALLGEPVPPLDVVASWTKADWDAVVAYCADTHLIASDNEIENPAPRPACMDGWQPL